MEETYEEFIDNILNIRGRFGCGDEYHERHHIVPKCMGGGNEKENLIDLYAREHFIAHKLLAEENPENDSLVYAWSCMAFPKNNTQKRYELTPNEYEEVRIALSKALTGRTISQETRDKIREKAIGRTLSDETRLKLSAAHSGEKNYWFGKSFPKEVRDKMSISQKERLKNPENNPMYGRPWWDENTPQDKIDEWRKHKSESSSGSNNPNYGNHWSQEVKDQIMHSNPNTKSVLQFNLGGCILHRYDSIRQVVRQTGFNRQNISRCCNYKERSCGGFFWMFESEYEKYGKLVYKQDNRVSGTIIQCTDNGDIIDTYQSLKEAHETSGVGLHAISKCLNKHSKHAGGYRWLYPDDYKDFITKQND